MRFKSPFICEIAPDTYAINEFGLSTMYLAVGKEKALLIDTGCGVCDLQEVVRNITDKPLEVALTHGHMDHCGGMKAFEKIYLNERDFEMTRNLDIKELKNYADMFGKAGGYEVYDYSPDMIRETIKLPEFVPLREGDDFELGDRTIEVYEIPGHTKGGLSFLDRKNRIIFSGDCCNTNLLAMDNSVSEIYEALKKFKSLSKSFDRNYNGHVGYMGSPNCFSQPKAVTDDLLYICQRILAGQGEPEEYEFLGYTLKKMKHGSAQLSYDPSNI